MWVVIVRGFFYLMASFQQKIRDIIRSPFLNKGLPLMVMLFNTNEVWKRFVHVVVMCRIFTKSVYCYIFLLSSLLRWMCLFLQGIYVIRGSYTCTDTKDDLQEKGQEEICCRPNITCQKFRLCIELSNLKLLYFHFGRTVVDIICIAYIVW